VLAAAAVFAIGLALSWSFATVTIQENALARDIDATKASIASEQARNARLQASLAEKRGSDYVIEKAKQLGWVWPWEALIAVERDASARAQATTLSERPSRLMRWIAVFIGPR
jgi:hypothetical protein